MHVEPLLHPDRGGNSSSSPGRPAKDERNVSDRSFLRHAQYVAPSAKLSSSTFFATDPTFSRPSATSGGSGSGHHRIDASTNSDGRSVMESLTSESLARERVVLLQSTLRVTKLTPHERDDAACLRIKRKFESHFNVEGVANLFAAVVKIPRAPELQCSSDNNGSGNSEAASGGAPSASKMFKSDENDNHQEFPPDREPNVSAQLKSMKCLFLTSPIPFFTLGTAPLLHVACIRRRAALVDTCLVVCSAVMVPVCGLIDFIYANELGAPHVLRNTAACVSAVASLVHLVCGCSRNTLGHLFRSAEVYYVLIATSMAMSSMAILAGMTPITLITTSAMIVLFLVCALTLDSALHLPRPFKGAVLVLTVVYTLCVVGWARWLNDVAPSEVELSVFGFFVLHALTLCTTGCAVIASCFSKYVYRVLVRRYDAAIISFPVFAVPADDLFAALPTMEAHRLELAQNAVMVSVHAIIPLMWDSTGVIDQAVVETVQLRFMELVHEFEVMSDVHFTVVVRRQQVSDNLFFSEKRSEAVGSHSSMSSGEPTFAIHLDPGTLTTVEELDGVRRFNGRYVHQSTQNFAFAPTFTLVPRRRTVVVPLLEVHPGIAHLVQQRAGTIVVMLVLVAGLLLEVVSSVIAPLSGDRSLHVSYLPPTSHFLILVSVFAWVLTSHRSLTALCLGTLEAWLLMVQVNLITIIAAVHTHLCGGLTVDVVANILIGIAASFVVALSDGLRIHQAYRALEYFGYILYNLLLLVVVESDVDENACGSGANLQFAGFTVVLLTAQQTLMLALVWTCGKYIHRLMWQRREFVVLEFGANLEQRVEAVALELMDRCRSARLSALDPIESGVHFVPKSVRPRSQGDTEDDGFGGDSSAAWARSAARSSSLHRDAYNPSIRTFVESEVA